jgi:DNA-binding GntR family transcriptional regulator
VETIDAMDAEQTGAGRSRRDNAGWRAIMAAMIDDVRTGRWQISDRLPSEANLCARFGVSRNTVREALRALETRGYIRRAQGTRPVLVSTDPSRGFVNSVRSIDELLQYSGRTLSRVLSVETVLADDALARRLGSTAGTAWLRVQILRLPRRGSAPLGFSEIYVCHRYAAIADRITADRTVYRLLQDACGLSFARVVQAIGVATASAAQASVLRVEPGSPLLSVRTEFVAESGETVEVGFGHFPQGRYGVEIILESGAAGDPSMKGPLA